MGAARSERTPHSAGGSCTTCIGPRVHRVHSVHIVHIVHPQAARYCGTGGGMTGGAAFLNSNAPKIPPSIPHDVIKTSITKNPKTKPRPSPEPAEPSSAARSAGDRLVDSRSTC